MDSLADAGNLIMLSSDLIGQILLQANITLNDHAHTVILSIKISAPQQVQ